MTVSDLLDCCVLDTVNEFVVYNTETGEDEYLDYDTLIETYGYTELLSFEFGSKNNVLVINI